jgi:DNA-binding GntR family transcriptional regulator
MRSERPGSLAEQAADAIRTRIVMGEFELGEALSETTVAARLGVSKTPIREAFLRLKTEGLVEIQPQRGTFVFQMSADEVISLSELREVLETAAVRLAIKRRGGALADALRAVIVEMRRALKRADALEYRTFDGEFHRTIMEHAGNAYLKASYETIAFRIQALRNRLSRDPALNRQSLKEHVKLAELVHAHDASRAAALLTKHIRATAANYVRTLGMRNP